MKWMMTSKGREWRYEKPQDFIRRIHSPARTWSRRTWKGYYRTVDARTKRQWHDDQRRNERAGLVFTEVGWLSRQAAEGLTR